MWCAFALRHRAVADGQLKYTGEDTLDEPISKTIVRDMALLLRVLTK